MLSEVINHPRQHSLRDVPAVLRQIANAIERGEAQVSTFAYVHDSPEGGIVVGVCGEYLDELHTIGLMHCGAQLLSSMKLLEGEIKRNPVPGPAA